MKIGITCYPTYGGSGAVATELGIALARGEIDRAAAARAVTVETRQYAKRQRTWFRHQLAGAPVTRVSPDDPRGDEIVDRWWAGEDAA